MKGWVEQDLDRYERKQAKAEGLLPICDCCGERIYDDYAYKFEDGSIYCEDCIDACRTEVRWLV